MIDPNIVTTVRVGELPPADFNLTDNLPHEIGEELKRGTVQQLADVIGGYLGTTDSLSFNPTTVSDGGTLPSTTSNEWMLAGKGTFQNVGGGADIVTTEELNAITSNGTYWSLAVEIPINVELAGITQNIRSGYTSTTPSEDVVFNRLAEIIGMIPGQQTTDEILNNSDVDGTTATDALNLLNSKIPTNYSKIVYVNDVDPNNATIFDLNNPPITNDNALKSDVNNLYIGTVGTDASTWVYNATTLNYATKTVTSATSNFNYFGTSTDAGNSKTASIERSGNINTTGRLTVGTDVPTETNIRVNRPITGAVSSNSILIDGVVKSDVTNSAFFNKTIVRTEPLSFTLPNMYHNYTSQGVFGAGSSVTNQYGFYTDASMIGATNNYGFYGNIPFGANRWNLYMNGTAPNYFNGNVSIGTTAQTGKLLVLTGVGNVVNVSGQPAASVVLGNLGTGLNEMPAVIGKTTNNTGLTMMASSEEVNAAPDMRLEIRRNDNSDFTDRTTPGFRFTRYGTNLVEILRNGNTTFIGNVTIPAGTVAGHAVNKSQLDLKADITALPTSGSYAPTLTNSTNVSSSVFQEATYTKVGNIVTVRVTLNVTPTASSTSTQMILTIPVNRTITTAVAVGSGMAVAFSSYVPCFVQTQSNNNQVALFFIPLNTNQHNVSITFQYSVN